jgi:GNAT superfamily N-acetyltransferase
LIREYREQDAAGAAALIGGIRPGWVITGEWLAHFVRTLPERARACFWIAEEEDEIVGWAESLFNWAQERQDAATVWSGDAPAQRGRGLGEALFAAAEAHALERGATRLRSEADAASAGAAFLERRGFHHLRDEVFSAVDLDQADLSRLAELEYALAAKGFRLARLEDVLDRPHELFELYAAAEADMPSDNPHTSLEYEEFVNQCLGSPLLDAEASQVALYGESPVSLAFVLVNRDARAAVHDMTGTLRLYRRRGLARLCKLATIRWAIEHGIERLMTSNDGQNEAMLGLNRELGYRPFATWAKYARETAAAPAPAAPGS